MFFGMMYIFRCYKMHCEKCLILFFDGREVERGTGGGNGNGDC